MSPDPAEEKSAAEPDRLLSVTLTSPHDGISVCRAIGEVDASSAPVLRSELQRAEAGDPRCVIVDLSGVRFLGSAGLQVLVDALEARGPGRVLVLVLDRNPANPLWLSGVDSLFRCYKTLDGALRECATES